MTTYVIRFRDADTPDGAVEADGFGIVGEVVEFFKGGQAFALVPLDVVVSVAEHGKPLGRRLFAFRDDAGAEVVIGADAIQVAVNDNRDRYLYRDGEVAAVVPANRALYEVVPVRLNEVWESE